MKRSECCPRRQTVFSMAATTSSDVSTKGGKALSLYHLLDPEVLADPYPLYRRLRTEDPVHWDPFLHAWVVTGYANVVHVLHHFSARRTPTPGQLSAMGLEALNPIAQVMVRQMLFLDPPDHTRLRALASAAFTPRRVELLRSHIQEIMHALLDALIPKGQAELIADFASPAPAIVTAEMLGVPVEDHQQLKEWSDGLRRDAGKLSTQSRSFPQSPAKRGRNVFLFPLGDGGAAASSSRRTRERHDGGRSGWRQTFRR